MKIQFGIENPIDYQAIISQLKGIRKVIFVGGISSALEGEEMPVQIEGFKGGDRTNIELPTVQRRFLKALHEAGKQVIYVNCSGSAIALTPETESCDAILQAWYPGQEGGTAVADVLFGKYNPSGKLPVTFYRSTSQLPDYEDYSMKHRTYRYFSDPLFAFGYGLSYTTFQIGKAQASANTIAQKNGKLNLVVPVTNSGSRDGDEIVQLYISNPQDTDGPSRQLRAFKRVTVKRGTTATVTLSLTSRSFEWWDASTNTVRVKPGTYRLLYGTSSRPEDLQEMNVEVK